MYLIGTLVRPSSTDSCTGMSSTRLMSLMTCSPPLTALAPLAAPARGGRTGSPPKGPPLCPPAGGWSPRLAAQGPPLLPLGGRLVAAFLLFQRLGPAIERVVRRVVCGGALASAGRAIFS